MSEKINKLFDKASEDLAKNLNLLKKEILVIQEACDALTGGAVAKVQQCKLAPLVMSYSVEIAKSSSVYSKPSWQLHAQEAQRLLEEEKNRIEALHLRNQAAIEHNKALKEKIIAFMESVGISKEYSSYEKPTPRAINSKWVTKRAGYLSDLDRLCSTSDNFEVCMRVLEEYAKKIKVYIQTKTAQDLEASNKKREETEKSDKLKKLAKLAVSYDCDVSFESVLAALLSKDKYLRLAHYLLLNRENWTEGPSLADTGLNSFEIETSEDQEIHNELLKLIVEWEGDGRVFRDCHFNYDFLFSKADSAIREDYELLHTLK